jgi:filamentous hemagglutinin family protein
MAYSWGRRGWKSQVGWFVKLIVVITCLPDPGWTQIIPDDTLGRERSQVTRTGAVDRIEGGSRRGVNLFHSFQEFNIREGERADFSTANGIENILTRVTGNDVSDLLGTLGVDGQANLFLLNPNGIIFGANARLDIGGSFVGSTSDAIGFGTQGFFNATNPEVPSQLLTIRPSAFIFNQIPVGNITVRGLATTRLGANVALLGRSINVDGRRASNTIETFGGRIDLGSSAGTGAIALDSNGGFIFPVGLQRGDVTFANNSRVTVESPDGRGAIVITARRIALTEGSELVAGIFSQQGSSGSQVGNIVLDATGAVLVTQSSEILNSVPERSLGNTGNIEITTPILEVLDGSRLSAANPGQGNAGHIVITASDRVTFQGSNGTSTAISESNNGNAGDIEITTPILQVLDGAELTSRTFQGTAGNVRIIASDRVTFRGTNSDGQLRSSALSAVKTEGNGTGGNIEIATPILRVLDGAQLSTENFGLGNSGSIIIRASDRVIFRGESQDGQSFSRAFSRVVRDSNDDSGSIQITTPILRVLNGAELSTSTSGQGEAGNVVIRSSNRVTFRGVSNNGARNSAANAEFFGIGGAEGTGGNIRIMAPILEVLDGARLNANTSGEGNAGSIFITASDRITLRGTGGIDLNDDEGKPFRSEISSSVVRHEEARNGGIGNGGDIIINTSRIDVLNGARLDASTFNIGNAGSIRIRASDRVTLQGVSNSDGGIRSGVSSEVAAQATGNGGNIEITTPSLEILDRAEINAQYSGEGSNRAGNILINASRMRLSNGAQVTANDNLNGRAGNIDLQISENLLLQRESEISSTTTRDGQGGNIRLNSSQAPTSFVSLTGHSVIATAATEATGQQGNAGNINLRVEQLNLQESEISTSTQGGVRGNLTIRGLSLLNMQDQSKISASTTSAVGGNVTITATEGFVVAGSQNNDIEARAEIGDGGRINITALSVFGLEERRESPTSSDIDASSDFGLQGTVEINQFASDPLQGIDQLPQDLLSARPAQGCQVSGGDASAELFLSGRGGISSSPYESLSSSSTVDDVRPPVSSTSSSFGAIAEAVNWQVNATGQVVLVGEESTTSIHRCQLR